MKHISWSSTSHANGSSDVPELPEVTPDELAQVYADWSASECKADHFAALPAAQACALVDYLTTLAKSAT